MKENNISKDLESECIKLASAGTEEECACSNYDMSTGKCDNTGNCCNGCFSLTFF